MWHLCEASQTFLVFPAENLYFLITLIEILDKLRKCCCKFTQYCSYLNHKSKKILTAAIYFSFWLENNWITPITLSIRQVFFSAWVFFGKFEGFLQYLFQKSSLVGRIYLTFWCLFIMMFLPYFTSLLFLYQFICWTLFFRTTCSSLAKIILQLPIQILLNSNLVKMLSVT